MTGPRWPACPECFSEDVEILHEQNPEAASTHATLECQDCGRVFKDIIEEPKDLEVRCVISDGAESEAVQITLPTGERIRVDDEVYGADQRLLVTAIEVGDDRRVQTAPVEDIKTLWCKNFDTVTLDVSVNKGHITHADEITVVPEETFYLGDQLTIHNQPVRVKAIKTKDNILRHRGSAEARDIVRIFTERTDWRSEQADREDEGDDAPGTRRSGGRSR